MDAIQFLKQEHDKAKHMFGQILEAGGEQRGQLWKKLQPELKVHEQMEETALYGPVARDARSDDQELNARHMAARSHWLSMPPQSAMRRRSCSAHVAGQHDWAGSGSGSSALRSMDSTAFCWT